MNPNEFRWCVKEDRLFPIPRSLPAAPEELLNLIACQCKITPRKDCDVETCACKRANLNCSKFCSFCEGISCTNSPPAEESDEEDDD